MASRTKGKVSQTSNDYMRDWKAHHRILYLKRIIENEAYPLSSCCNQCAKADSLYRCDDCSGQALWCKECCLEFHQTSPFHHPKKWNGRFFKPLDLDKMGLTLFFGHGGKPSPTLSQHTDPGPSHIDEDGDIVMEDPGPNADGWEDEVQTGFIGDRLRLVHTTGIFSRRVGWCGCMCQDGLVMPQDMQLLEAQFHPATSDRPSTAFIFNVLDEFAIDTLECNSTFVPFKATKAHQSCVSPVNTKCICCIHQMLLPVAQSDCFETCWSVISSESREPGKNVSLDEVQASSDPKLYRPQIVVNGNFKLDNLKMRNPGDDVCLSDGEMFCVGSIQYDEHRLTQWESEHVPVLDMVQNAEREEREDLALHGVVANPNEEHGKIRRKLLWEEDEGDTRRQVTQSGLATRILRPKYPQMPDDPKDGRPGTKKKRRKNGWKTNFDMSSGGFEPPTLPLMPSGVKMGNRGSEFHTPRRLSYLLSLA
ncbi:hypothetical protein B0H11DRAFT_2188727 [Mycena galericulata]|nr:hypothetical protein B0H11DRAFT_2188727 [Mycena galericulata]